MLPLLLIILDGWGIAPASKFNAISLAKTRIYDNFLKRYPSTKLNAFGDMVGLPVGQVGNSEAGHMNIGGGRSIIQDSVIITKEIENKHFFKNPAFLKCIDHTKKHKSKMHLIGLLSNDQCPHMHPAHVQALLELLEQQGVEDIVLHFFTDGRDSPPQSALTHWEFFKKLLKPNIRLATVCGRLYLDRKKKWQRTEKLYNLLTSGVCVRQANSFEEAIDLAYKNKETDEFIEPTVIKTDKPSTIDDRDGIIFFNLRSDRARQLTMAFAKPDFDGFQRKKKLPNICFVAMTDFGPVSVLTAYPGADIGSTIPMSLSSLKQLYIAETEKYAHITYFFNGGYEDPVGGEQRILVKSPDVKSYDETPCMAAGDITNIIVKSLDKQLYDIYVVNYANPDMVGHTGNLEATIRACEVVDKQLAALYLAVSKKRGTIIITSDHGNAEILQDPKTGQPHTYHTTNPVPFILVNSLFKENRFKRNDQASLGSIGPTIVDLLKLPLPQEMVGRSLLHDLV